MTAAAFIARSVSMYVPLIFLSAFPFAFSQQVNLAEVDSSAKVQYVDSQPLSLVSEDGGAFRTSVPVRNPGNTARRVKFCVVDSSSLCSGAVRVIDPNVRVDAGEVRVLQIELTGFRMPLSGYLSLITLDEAERGIGYSFRPLKLNAQLFPASAWIPIGVTFGLAALVCWVVGYRLSNAGVSMSGMMGNHQWDFSKSWASNITVAGALLSAGLALGALPEQTHYMNKAGYATLNLLFMLLAATAPFVANTCSKHSVAIEPSSGSGIDYWGNVWSFLVAGAITLFAVTSQLVILAVVLNEFLVAHEISRFPVRVFQILIAVLSVFVIVYCEETLYWTAKALNVPRTQPASETSLSKAVASPRLRRWAPL